MLIIGKEEDCMYYFILLYFYRRVFVHEFILKK